jgi:hypothetical protein
MAYPNNYREADLVDLMTRLLIKRRCVWMVGVGSVGKTHLIEHVSDYQNRNRPVQTHLLEKVRQAAPDLNVTDPSDLVFVRIDPNAMLDPDVSAEMTRKLPRSWYGIELIFRKLVEICDILEVPGEEVQANMPPDQRRELLLYEQIRRNYALILDQSMLGPVRAFALLEDAINIVFTHYIEGRLANNRRRRTGRLIIVFDEFERLVKMMPNEFFLNLRALRDRFRYKLLFVVVARKEAIDVIPSDRRRHMESFTELFQAPLYIAGGRTKDDQDIMFTQLTDKQNWTEQAKSDALRITGAHGGLLRSVVLQRDLFQRRMNETELVDNLLGRNEVVEECHIMLESISTRERQVMDAVLTGQTIDLKDKHIKRVFDSLIGKHILILQANTIYWVIPLFWRFYHGYRNKEYPNDPYPPDTLPM